LTPDGDYSLLINVPTSTLGLTQPSNQWVPGALYLVLNWSGYEGVHSPPSSVKREKTQDYTLTLPYAYKV